MVILDMLIGFNHHTYSSIQGAGLYLQVDKLCYLLVHSSCKNNLLIDMCFCTEAQYFYGMGFGFYLVLF